MDARRMITAWVAVGAAEGLRLAGVTAGEVSERQARKTYGKWFDDEAECYTPAELLYK